MPETPGPAGGLARTKCSLLVFFCNKKGNPPGTPWGRPLGTPGRFPKNFLKFMSCAYFFLDKQLNTIVLYRQPTILWQPYNLLQALGSGVGLSSCHFCFYALFGFGLRCQTKESAESLVKWPLVFRAPKTPIASSQAILQFRVE